MLSVWKDAVGLAEEATALETGLFFSFFFGCALEKINEMIFSISRDHF